jgi:hypothetical protein
MYFSIQQSTSDYTIMTDPQQATMEDDVADNVEERNDNRGGNVLDFANSLVFMPPDPTTSFLTSAPHPQSHLIAQLFFPPSG